MKKHQFLKLLLLSSCAAFSQIDRDLAESNFYSFPASHNARQVDITTFGAIRNDGRNDTQAINNAINSVSNQGGGTVFIPNGTYHLNNVVLRTDVRILVSTNAILKPFKIASQNANTFTYIMFNGGNQNFATRVAVQCDTENEQFTIDFRGTPYQRSRAFSMTNIQDFYISGINHFDNKSIFPTLNLSITGPENALRAPKNGVIKNMTVNNTVSGYGLIQMQAAEDILFKNLTCSGGITLRLESDFRRNSFRPVAQQRKINQIFGRDIRCTDGQAAVQLSPHTIDQGVVDVRNISSVGCEYTVKIESGFITNEERQRGLTPGSFNSNSFFGNIRAVWGPRAQVRPVFLRFLPCGIRDRIVEDNNVNEESFIAPSLAPILMFERGNAEKVAGYYGVKIGLLERVGFNDAVPNIVRDFCTDDFENCGNDPIRIFYPPVCRNRNFNRGFGSKAIKEDANSKIVIGSNPVQNYLSINAEKEVTVDIFNISNQNVLHENLNAKAFKTVDVSHLSNGIYFAKLTSNGKTVVKKIIKN